MRYYPRKFLTFEGSNPNCDTYMEPIGGSKDGSKFGYDYYMEPIGGSKDDYMVKLGYKFICYTNLNECKYNGEYIEINEINDENVSMSNILFYIYDIGGCFIYPEENIEKLLEHWSDNHEIITYDEWIIKGILE